MTDCKVQAARKLLASGTPPHEVAHSLGCRFPPCIVGCRPLHVCKTLLSRVDEPSLIFSVIDSKSTPRDWSSLRDDEITETATESVQPPNDERITFTQRFLGKPQSSGRIAVLPLACFLPRRSQNEWIKLRFPIFERERPRAVLQRHQMVGGHFIVNAEHLEPHSTPIFRMIPWKGFISLLSDGDRSGSKTLSRSTTTLENDLVAGRWFENLKLDLVDFWAPLEQSNERHVCVLQ
jgi:hypothetical protein